ncbi:MAG TPA: nicotinate-nucleotide adenylyltransferase [Methylophilaceae bacterium]|nr:nicotinate-nucleotide adenylyltransferase [Methylophilaceae bacterium]
MRMIGVMGGTFDPIHFGHLRMAQELSDALQLDEVRFIPAATPPHRKQPASSAQHRAAMVKLAIADNPLFKLDTCELERDGASYTIDTLTLLREETGSESSLHLLLGSDAFFGLPSWHRWQEILKLCHIVVAHRPHSAPDKRNMQEPLQNVFAKHQAQNINELAQQTSGEIWLQHITALDISATYIREQFKSSASARYLMPDSVIEYIDQHQLYR